MTPNSVGDQVDHADPIASNRRRVHTALATRITELADVGLTPHEIAARLGLPLPLVTLVLRGATLKESIQ